MAFLRLLLFYGLIGLLIYGYVERDKVLPMLGETWHEIEVTAEEIGEEIGLTEETSAPEPTETAAVEAEAAAEPVPETPAPAPAPKTDVPAPAPAPKADTPAPAPAPRQAAAPVPAQPQPQPQVWQPQGPSPQTAPSPAHHPGAAPAPAAPAPVAGPPTPRFESDLDRDLRARWVAARQAFYDGDHAAAERIYRQLAEDHPRLPDVTGELGNLYYYQKRFDLAADAYFQTGRRLVESGRSGRAASMVAALQRLDPQRAEELRGLMMNQGR